MPVAVVFRCEICGRRPGPETQAALEWAGRRGTDRARSLRRTARSGIQR